MRKALWAIPALALLGLLFLKPPSLAHENPMPTSSITSASDAPQIGGKRGDGEHEGREHEGRERNDHEGGDDDGGRLPKPPSNH